MNDNEELLELQRQHGKLSREYKQLKALYKSTLGQMNAIRPQMLAIGKQIQDYKENLNSLLVSDHAYKRYMERVLKVDMDKVTKEILEGSDKFDTVIDRNIVVTVVTSPEDEE